MEKLTQGRVMPNAYHLSCTQHIVFAIHYQNAPTSRCSQLADIRAFRRMEYLHKQDRIEHYISLRFFLAWSPSTATPYAFLTHPLRQGTSRIKRRRSCSCHPHVSLYLRNDLRRTPTCPSPVGVLQGNRFGNLVNSYPCRASRMHCLSNLIYRYSRTIAGLLIKSNYVRFDSFFVSYPLSSFAYHRCLFISEVFQGDRPLRILRLRI